MELYELWNREIEEFIDEDGYVSEEEYEAVMREIAERENG